MRISVVALFVVGLFASPSRALEPANVFLIVNKNEPKSRMVADHYCQMRKVPPANIVELDLPYLEDITRKDYDAKLARPLRAALQSRRRDVKVLLSTYGVSMN